MLSTINETESHVKKGGNQKADRQPPHCEASEAALLSAALGDDGHTLDALTHLHGITADQFSTPRHRLVFRRLCRMRDEGKPIDLIVLADELHAARELQDAGGALEVAQLADIEPTTAKVSYHAKRLHEHHLCRSAIIEAAAIAEAAREPSPDATQLQGMIRRATERLIKLVEENPASRKPSPLEMLESHRRSHDSPPPKEPAVFTAAGVPVATAGNLTTIMAQAKSGKTAFIGAFIGASLASAGHGDDGDFLGVEAGARKPKGVALLIDTEQSPHDHHSTLERAARRAGVEGLPAWVHAFTVCGFGPKDLRTMLTAKLEALRAEGLPVWFVVIDGITDLLCDPNSLEESQEVITELMAHASAHSCPIIAVIHRNEGRMADPSARGHIGKQLARKAAYNIVLEKDADEITTVYATQNRGAPILKKDGPRFRYDPAAGMHVTTITESKSREDERADELRQILADALPNGGPVAYTEIKAAIVSARGCAERTAERHIKEATKLDVIRAAGAGRYEIKAA